MGVKTVKDQKKDHGRPVTHSLALKAPQIIDFFSVRPLIRNPWCTGGQILVCYNADEEAMQHLEAALKTALDVAVTP